MILALPEFVIAKGRVSRPGCELKEAESTKHPL